MICGRYESRTRFVFEDKFRRRHPVALLQRIMCGFLLILVHQGPTSEVFAQSIPVRTTDNGAGSSIPGIQNPASDHYTIVALRVEFQPDSSRFTTGDGTFGGILYEGTSPPKVDPFPHDSDYFKAHLTFLSNYIRRASSGRTTLSYHLLQKTIQVSKQMGFYSPTGFESESDAETAKLAALVVEAWELADADPEISLPRDLDPERTAFVLFHAGVGRDIELLGNTLDKTPADLPSLFFDSDTMGRLTGHNHIDFDGFPVSNSMIIPRTETRRGTDFLNDEAFLVELSINGMLAASFLNYLEVPDLFNTSSGASAIGPFGVMDGLGIFSFSGLLPPQPSAWTKLYLGWADLIFPDISAPDGGAGQIVSLQHSGDSVRSEIFVVPISDAEYFLVENRNRDPENDGIHLKVFLDGEIQEVVFENGAPDFNAQTISGFPGGVIVDADNFDFVLPGGKDENGELLNGGILIWHIDERRLAEGLKDNSVNADSSRRSVSLEEADSAEDIGFPNQSFLGPSFDQGSPFDFFYEGNPFSVITAAGQEIVLYENRFGPGTWPSSGSNEGGPSFVELRNFSSPAATMTFTYSRVAESGFEQSADDRVDSAFGEGFSGTNGVLRYVGSPGMDYMGFSVDSDEINSGGPDPVDAGRLFITKSGSIAGGITNLLNARPAVFGGAVYAASAEGFWKVSPEGVIELLVSFPSTVSLIRSTSAVVAMLDGSLYVAVETPDGSRLFSFQDGVFKTEILDAPVRSLAVVDGLRLAVVYDDHVEIRSTNSFWTFDRMEGEPLFQAFFWTSRKGQESFRSAVVPDAGRRRLLLLLEDSEVLTIDFADYEIYGVTGDLSGDPVVLDIDDDKIPEIIVTVGQWLLAFRINGVLVDSFPIKMRAPAFSQPLFARFQDGGAWTAIIAGVDGQIDAYDLTFRNRRVPGFPLSVGAAHSAAPVLREGTIAGLSDSGSLTVWNSDRLLEGEWQDVFQTDNSNFIELVVATNRMLSESGTVRTEAILLAPEKTYNWPNPVTSGVTRIRVEPALSCDIQITIINSAGVFVAELEMKAVPAGIASEVEWRTDAASGLYLARVTATIGSRVETHLIKIAIIR